ncbi:MAG TPA: ECF-type sigma factor [Opitutaceae bacterium]|nr:ECF-type sigma factor [Opitutaceae bacterium]
MAEEIKSSSAGSGAELLPAVYAELRRVAAARLAGGTGSTLQPTALVHEAWLRLGGDGPTQWRDKTHFFAAAAEAMRHILIDRARRRQTQRHGGGQQRVDLDVVEVAIEADDERLLAINDAVERLAAHDAAKADLVKLRYFAGLSLAEAAQALGVSEPTAKRWWAYARTWLYREMGAHPHGA